MKKDGVSNMPVDTPRADDDMNIRFKQALALHQAGRLDEARILYEKILASDDRHAGALANLGLIHLQRGDRVECVRLLGKSLEIVPNQPAALNILGTALQGLNRLDEALASYDRALALRPDLVETHYNRGNTLQTLNRLDEAVTGYDHAIALRPEFFEAHNNRCIALERLNRLEEALGSCDRAIALRPDVVQPHNNRGNILKKLGRVDEALACYDRAIALRPDYVEAHYNRGNTLQFFLHRPDEALLSYARALELKPDYPYLLGTWMHCKMLCCEWTDLEAAWARVTSAIDRGETAAAPFAIPAIPASPAQQRSI